MKKILHQPWGGLGDNLQYSTLPERFSELGYEVYISDKNACRNFEIFELVWKLNPYVKGISSESANIGESFFVKNVVIKIKNNKTGKIVDKVASMHSRYKRAYSNKSIIYNQEALHGFDPKNETPKIYYKPKTIHDFQDKIFIDLSAVSNTPIKPKNLDEYLQYKHPNLKIIIPNFDKKIDNKQNINFNYNEDIKIQSIFHFCDLIHSCKHFYCCLSGQATLASALNKKETTVFIKPEWENIDWMFPNLKYEIIK